MKKILITGGAGYLGQRLVTLADAAYTVQPTFFINPIAHPHAAQVDLRDWQAVEKTIRAFQPEVIIHQAIANTKPEHIESIVPAAQNLARASREFNFHLIHVSSDLVFDGKHPPYTEESAPAPVNTYGEAKATAEELLQRATPQLLIVRPSLIYGFQPLDKQTSWLVNGIEQQQTVKLFTDEYRCPIWVDNLAQILLEAAERHLRGILNLGGPSLSRWDYGLKLLKHLQIDPQGHVVPSTIEESGLLRPADLTLDCRKAQQILQTKILPSEEVFALNQKI